ncbi:hypothetical protein Tco_0132113 [Tanacetum coccineum]
MSEGLKSRKKPSNPEKISNFMERVKGLKVYVGKFTYECDFVMLEDTSSVIDPYLGGTVLGKPFVKETSTWMTFRGNTHDLAQLEKKQTRLRLYTKSFEEIPYSGWRWHRYSLLRRHIIQETTSGYLRWRENVTALKDTLKALSK